MPNCVRPCLVVLLAAAAPLWASGPPSAGVPASLADAAQFAPGPAARWSITAGMVFRPLSAGFTLRSPGPLSLAIPRGGSTGRDPGLFHGGSAPVRYDDGSVGPDWASDFLSQGLPAPAAGSPGLADSEIHSASQVAGSGRPNGLGGEITEVRFHSSWTTTSYFATYSAASVQTSDQKTGIGPSLELRYEASQGGPVGLAFTLGYSWVSAGLAPAGATVASETLHRTTRQDRSTHAYDYFGAFPSGSSFPLADRPFGGIIFDLPQTVAALGPPPPGADYRQPREFHESSTSTRAVATYLASASAKVDVNLHEMILAVEARVPVGKRLHVGLSVGPTLNALDLDLQSRVDWREAGSNRIVKTLGARCRDSAVELGVAGRIVVRADLGSGLFIEASTGYHYVPKVRVADRAASAEVDVSGMQTLVGLGRRF